MMIIRLPRSRSTASRRCTALAAALTAGRGSSRNGPCSTLAPTTERGVEVVFTIGKQVVRGGRRRSRRRGTRGIRYSLRDNPTPNDIGLRGVLLTFGRRNTTFLPSFGRNVMLPSLRAALVRVRELFRRRSRIAAERDDEFSFHIEMETRENMRLGLSEADAHRAALLRFGGAQRFREETTDARGVVALDNLARDTRFAIRRIKRAPAFAVGVIATLGIGVGAAVGIGTIVYDVLLRDLPYSHPDRL